MFLDRPETRRLWALFYLRSLEKDVRMLRSYVTRSTYKLQNRALGAIGGAENLFKRAGANGEA